MYEAIFSVLKRLDPELTHHLGMLVVKFAGIPFVSSILRRRTRLSPAMQVRAMGLIFESPLGLAAGFDKNAEAIRGFYALGFGHVEVGTVTPRPQPGNPQPRLFRLPSDEALLNRMGFNNQGVARMKQRLERLRRRGGKLPVIGVNIGKNRDTPLEKAIDDYVVCTRELAELADYLVVNVSSPNTPGLRGLQDTQSLKPLLEAVLTQAGTTPVLVKIAPDMSDGAIADVVKLVRALKLAGIVATNTTTSREGLFTNPDTIEAMGDGGISGRPLADRSLDVLGLIRQTLPREYCVMSVGGVFTGEDVHERIRDGATLVQAYTGFVYRGPFFASKVLREMENTP
ncbi:MAG: hypothetical protein RL247_276 [Actinomycetota bacterium]|jgi:dihydroorotate dehydrogenase